MIELVNVTKAYPRQARPAVDGLSLTLADGEITALVGPSGCGKSTTIRLINGMIPATSGTIRVDGRDIGQVPPDELRRGIGYVIQQIGLLPHRTVAQNVAVVPRLLGWPKERTRARVDELLRLVGLDPRAMGPKYPLQLSGGQMQRVGVARAMAADPPIMLMDEPFGAVDPITRRGLQDEFLRLQRQMRKTICFVTHDINEAIKMGDKIAIMDQGRLVQFDTPMNILSAPANAFVRDFIGTERVAKKLNVFHAGDVAVPLAALPRAPLGALVAALRAYVAGAGGEGAGGESASGASAGAGGAESALTRLLGDSGLEVAVYGGEGAGGAGAVGPGEGAGGTGGAGGRRVGFVSHQMLEALGGVPGAEAEGALLLMMAGRERLCVSEATPLADAFSVMLEHNAEHLTVTGAEGGEAVGVLSFKGIREHVSNVDRAEAAGAS